MRPAYFVPRRPGGLRTALDELGRGYQASGHEPVLVVPGEVASDRNAPQGRVITLPGPLLHGTGRYRVLTDRRGCGGCRRNCGPAASRSPTVPNCAQVACGPPWW
ncbi:hypothetical protein [Streptomyces sp. NRRL S-118]|uniref:hypothetical protein n=1 Tax=Streptomyces sp. NRRL S-118 TaxID=1463881 RepID=UPI0004CB6DD5|nr:hypothetical protein [Streptomyces sp. NRRL S-118]